MTTSFKSPRRFFKELRFQQLRALVEVSRLKSFAAAAAELNWRRLRSGSRCADSKPSSESSCGPIEGKNVELTEDGQVLVDGRAADRRRV